MGKRRIIIEKIERNERRQVTFCKRRKGLFQKAADLCLLCDVKVAVVVFSPAGRPYIFGHPSVDAILDLYLTGKNLVPDAHANAKLSQLCNEIRTLQCELRNEQARWKLNCACAENDTATRGGESTLRYWWDSIDLEHCDDLLSLRNSLEKLKKNVLKRAEELSLKAVGADIGSTSSSSSVGYGNDDEHSIQKIEASHDNFKHLPLHLDGGGVTHQIVTDVIKDDVKACLCGGGRAEEDGGD
ncbi:PREDICTED: agamous-like MADS-box protein AGL23 [Nelumbo nucifera]|uniref:Agamous-like MADS-box protein AGL23 n=2 Tax=Nelumbo nucifera TaxID=4432 RepID=A0A1U8AP33_NELNU|nr:PREDICTED: agamous-like MADS-box protein AGL23 [Nelumbo nucifera]DAD33107.1 TPA_asm: hypothetical protein HUJ06_011958 [Nelumbo nucifera]